MIKKLKVLIALYYSSFIVIACCDVTNVYTVKINSLEFKYDGGVFIAVSKDIEIEDQLQSGTIASLRNFQSANALSECPEDEYYVLDTVTEFKITSNKDFNDSLLAGADLKEQFQLDYYYYGYGNPEYYSDTVPFTWFVLYQKTIEDSSVLRDVYFDVTLEDGTNFKDTIKEVYFASGNAPL